jgi:UDP-glucose 4-epimerase
LGNGKQIKPYLYVKDLLEGILFVCENTRERFNVFNLGADTRTTVKEIAEMVIEEMGLPATIRYTGGDRGWIGDVPEFKYDLSKVNALGWKAPHTSNESVRLAIQKALGK